MINTKFYLKDLSKDDLYMNLIFRALCNSYTLDDGVISYSELTSKAMKEEDIRYLLDVLSTNEKYIHDYIEYFAVQEEALYVIKKKKEFAKFFIKSSNVSNLVARYSTRSLSSFVEVYISYGLIEELDGFFVKLLESLTTDPVYDDEFDIFKGKLMKTKSNIKEAEDFLTKIKTLFSFER